MTGADFRHALTEQREVSTLAEEVMLARRYLSIEQVRQAAGEVSTQAMRLDSTVDQFLKRVAV